MARHDNSTIKVILRFVVLLVLVAVVLVIFIRLFMSDAPLFENIKRDLRIAHHNMELQRVFADEYTMNKVGCKVSLYAEPEAITLELVFRDQEIFEVLTKNETYQQCHVFAQFAKLHYNSIEDVSQVRIKVHNERRLVTYEWVWTLEEL